MATVIDVFNGNATNSFVIQQANGAPYDLLVVNVTTGVVTSALLPAATTDYLTTRVQQLLALVPGLSTAALKKLITNLMTLDQLEGAFTATVTDVGPIYTLTLSGLATPSNIEMAIPLSSSSPFTGNVLSGASGAPPAVYSWNTRAGDGDFNVPPDTETLIEFPNTIAENPVGAVTATNPWTFTCPVGKAGLYQIAASLPWRDDEGGTNFSVNMYALVNGFSGDDRGPEFTEFFTSSRIDTGSANIMQVTGSLILDEGDTLQLAVYQSNDAGTDLFIDDSLGEARAACYCDVVYIGPATFPG